MRKKFIYVLWALVVGVLLVIALIFTAIAKGWIGYVPPIEELENPNLKFATEIISDDGKMLGTWSLSKENRVFVGYDQLSSNLIRALIATEDERFAEHSGIDARALDVRAAGRHHDHAHGDERNDRLDQRREHHQPDRGPHRLLDG